jgi:hypothetical protein
LKVYLCAHAMLWKSFDICDYALSAFSFFGLAENILRR